MKQKIGVVPRQEFEKRARLFAALSESVPVEFVTSPLGDERQLAGTIEFVARENPPVSPGVVSTIRVPIDSEIVNTHRQTVQLSDNEHLDPVLRGRTLTEFDLDRGPRLDVQEGDTVLASVNDAPLWVARENRQTKVWQSALSLRELSGAEGLRDRLCYGKFAALLPVVQFLRHISASSGYVEPPLRATFLIDDPNLHRPRYGYLKYEELALHATTHNYHVAMATIPLDGWFANKQATKIFRRWSQRLSLLVHGNDHVHHELASFSSENHAVSCLAQALQRIQDFEYRTGVDVSRVMAPPHGVCASESIAAMWRLGYDALCVSRPYPWLPAPPGEMPLASWFAADFVAGGFSIIPRYHLTKPREDLILRAFLGQPLVLYGHHEDAAKGLDIFADAAALINSLGQVRWCSLADISRTNCASRIENGTLFLRTYSNRVEIDIPSCVNEVSVSTPRIHQPLPVIRPLVNGDEISASAQIDDCGRFNVRFAPQQGLNTISLEHPESIDIAKLPTPKWRPWPLARRLLTEGRDRIRPLLSR